jgi:hypothetical protein
LTAALLQALLVFGAVQFEQTLEPVLVANRVIGVWLGVNGAGERWKKRQDGCMIVAA